MYVCVCALPCTPAAAWAAGSGSASDASVPWWEPAAGTAAEGPRVETQGSVSEDPPESQP